MRAVNTSYKLTEQMTKEKSDVLPNDETIALLHEMVIEGNDYLLYRISHQLNTVMISIYEAHGKDKSSLEHIEVFDDMKAQLQAYTNLRETEDAAKAQAIMCCRQLGLDASKLTEEEFGVLLKTVTNSPIPNRRFRRKYSGQVKTLHIYHMLEVFHGYRRCQPSCCQKDNCSIRNNVLFDAHPFAGAYKFALYAQKGMNPLQFSFLLRL